MPLLPTKNPILKRRMGSVVAAMGVGAIAMAIFSPSAMADYDPPDHDPPRGGTTTSGLTLR